jgi:hypothetical protein
MMWSWRKWLCITAGLLVIEILFVSVFNYTTDSLGLFHEDGILNASRDLNNGKMIAGLVNSDDRMLQKMIIENRKDKIDVIALGSSRTMQLRKAFLNDPVDKKFFNHSMNTCLLGDYIAIIGIYEAKGYLPKKMIFGIDPWIFNKNADKLEPRSIGYYYKVMRQKIEGIKKDKKIPNEIINAKYIQLVNLEYTMENIRYLRRPDKKYYYIVKSADIDDYIIDTDGSRYYPFKIRNSAEVSGNIKAESAAHSLEEFQSISNQDLFEKFMKYLVLNHVEVIIFLTPYHPDAYRALMNHPQYRIVDDVEAYLREFASRNHIALIGSYNPEKYRFQAKDFFDPIHGHESVTKTIFEKEYSRSRQ